MSAYVPCDPMSELGEGEEPDPGSGEKLGGGGGWMDANVDFSTWSGKRLYKIMVNSAFKHRTHNSYFRNTHKQ